jgi:glucose dehydrogenase
MLHVSRRLGGAGRANGAAAVAPLHGAATLAHRDQRGLPRYGPAGVGVWTSPAVDPRTGTVFVGTGNNYIGTPTSLEDSIVAIDAATGAQKWATQLSDPEAWNFSCVLTPGLFNCPVPGNDFDFGASPNVFRIGTRTVVGEGQKSGLYHVLDAATGQIVWQDMLSSSPLPPAIAAGLFGIEWGTSYDGKHIYVATNQANPGTMFALSPATGKLVWKTPVSKLTCLRPRVLFRPRSPIGCLPALPGAVSSSPGLVWEGGQDGILRAYDSTTGRVLWSYDTVRRYRHTTDGVPGIGGSIDGGGTVIAHGTVYSNSGYTHRDRDDRKRPTRLRSSLSRPQRGDDAPSDIAPEAAACVIASRLPPGSYRQGRDPQPAGDDELMLDHDLHIRPPTLGAPVVVARFRPRRIRRGFRRCRRRTRRGTGARRRIRSGRGRR